MKLYKFLITMVLSFICLVSIAAEGKWTKGYGQGNLEFFIEKGNARLYVGCPSQESNNGGDVRVMFFVGDKEVKNFKIKVDGETYNGYFDSSTRNGANAIISFIDSVQKADAKVTYGTNTVVFPKSNVSKIMPPYISGKLGCAFN